MLENRFECENMEVENADKMRDPFMFKSLHDAKESMREKLSEHGEMEIPDSLIEPHFLKNELINV